MWRHDKVGQAIHWKLCQKFSLPCKDKWYDHAPEGVMENDQVKVLWDFRVQTDHHLEHNRPDIVVLEKEERTCSVIDVACPFDTRVLENEQEKWTNIKTSKEKSRRSYQLSLGLLVGTSFKASVKKVGLDDSTSLLQNAFLFERFLVKSLLSVHSFTL